MAKVKWDPIYASLPLIGVVLYSSPKLGMISLVIWLINLFSSKLRGKDLTPYSTLRPGKSFLISFSSGEREVAHLGSSLPRINPYSLLFPKGSVELPEIDGIYEEPGILYGILERGNPLVLNRFKVPPHSEIILGKTGSGKTMFARSVAMRYSIWEGSPVYVIDPLGDYSEEVEMGKFIPFSYPEVIREMRARRRGIVLIDEGWRELKEHGERVSEMFRICRHYEWGITLITQDPNDLRGREEILRNSRYLFLFNLPSLPSWFERALGLEEISEEISRLRQGEAFLIYRGKWKFRTYLGDVR